MRYGIVVISCPLGYGRNPPIGELCSIGTKFDTHDTLIKALRAAYLRAKASTSGWGFGVAPITKELCKSIRSSAKSLATQNPCVFLYTGDIPFDHRYYYNG